ncbi:MAG: ABC transporter permease [Chloroflexi bacterium]|nr:ABC transporter permease [Chloroflexota bacterium]
MSQWSNNNPARSGAERWLGYWNLLISLVGRDIRARYRRTFLGPLWAIIPAILATVIYSFLGGLVNVDTEGAPRLVFTFAATVPWTLFQSTAVRIPHGVLANGVLLRKMPMPRQIIPFVVVLTTFFDFVMAGVVLAVTLLLFGIPISAAWLWLPLLIVLTILLGWTVGIGIAAFTIYRRDMLHGIQHIMQVWLILTPVIYAAKELQSDLQLVYRLNPAVGIIDGFRRVLVFGQAPDGGQLLTSLVLICLGLLVAYPLYEVMSRYFTDVL